MLNDNVFSWPISNAEVLMCFQEFFLISIAHAQVARMRSPLFISERNNRQGEFKVLYLFTFRKKTEKKKTVFLEIL
jgi:hypothetical protein